VSRIYLRQSTLIPFARFTIISELAPFDYHTLAATLYDAFYCAKTYRTLHVHPERNEMLLSGHESVLSSTIPRDLLAIHHSRPCACAK